MNQRHVSEWSTRWAAVAIAGVLDAIVLWCAAPDDRPALIALVAFATLLLIGSALFRINQPVLPALFLLGSAFVAIDGLGAIPRAFVVPYAFGLFLAAEFAYESVRSHGKPTNLEGDRPRLLYIGIVAGASLLVSLITLVAAAMLSLGAIVELIGLGAGVGVVGLIGVIAMGPRRRPQPIPIPARTDHDRQPRRESRPQR